MGPARDGIEPMRFDTFISAHAQWKMRLRTLLDSGDDRLLDPDEAEAGDRCELGAWLCGEGRRHAADPAFELLERAHRDFHRAAASVVKEAAAGRRLEAEALLVGEYARRSAALVNAIIELRRGVGGVDGGR